MSGLSATKQFTSSNGKIKELGCPHEGDGEMVELTAFQYTVGRKCLCQYCWSHRHRVRRVETWKWDADER